MSRSCLWVAVLSSLLTKVTRIAERKKEEVRNQKSDCAAFEAREIDS